MTVLETDRLVLRHLTLDDAPFILALLNDPDFLRYIGDKGVRSLDDACAYLRDGPMDSYRRHGYGLYLTCLKAAGAPIGICGLVRRAGLDAPDIGYAFLPQYRGLGYATEAGAAVLADARTRHGLTRVVAVTSLDNESSIRVLQKLGLRLDRQITLPGQTDASLLYTPTEDTPAG